MSFPKLEFPLEVDFAKNGYWIGNAGPYKYGAAVTAFFIGDDLTDGIGDGLALMRELEPQLQFLGGHLQPYAPGREPELTAETMFTPPVVNCSVSYALRAVDTNAAVMVERYTFGCLWDFLYMEMCRAIQMGNTPRQCRRCGNWFLHEQGDKFFYCSRVAPGEEERTCREIGASANFEQKVKNNGVWLAYKRAYKKYYARMMKGNMSREEFTRWASDAEQMRDNALDLLREADSEEQRSRITETLRTALNEK